MMKKAFLYCSLLVFFSACGSETTTADEQASETPNTQVTEQAPEAAASSAAAEVVDTSSPNDGCPTSELIAYLKDTDDSGTNIRNSPGGEVVMTVGGEADEAQYMLRLTASKDGWFKIKSPIEGMEEDLEVPGNEAWIHASVIAVNTRNYSGQDLELLDKPESGKVVRVIEEESFGLRLKELCGSWAKVNYEGADGWIEVSWLCGIPWTTCA